MTTENIKKILSHLRKNLYILIKSVWVAGLYVHNEYHIKISLNDNFQKNSSTLVMNILSYVGTQNVKHPKSNSSKPVYIKFTSLFVISSQAEKLVALQWKLPVGKPISAKAFWDRLFKIKSCSGFLKLRTSIIWRVLILMLKYWDFCTTVAGKWLLAPA